MVSWSTTGIVLVPMVHGILEYNWYCFTHLVFFVCSSIVCLRWTRALRCVHECVYVHSCVCIRICACMHVCVCGACVCGAFVYACMCVCVVHVCVQ